MRLRITKYSNRSNNLWHRRESWWLAAFNELRQSREAEEECVTSFSSFRVAVFFFFLAKRTRVMMCWFPFACPSRRFTAESHWWCVIRVTGWRVKCPPPYRSRSNCVCVFNGFARVYWLISGLEIWSSRFLRAHPVIMSDILDGLRSYPLFMYSQVWNLGQLYFIFSPSHALRLLPFASAGRCMKPKQRLSVLCSAAVAFWKEETHKSCPCRSSGPGALLLLFIFIPDNEHSHEYAFSVCLCSATRKRLASHLHQLCSRNARWVRRWLCDGRCN